MGAGNGSQAIVTGAAGSVSGLAVLTAIAEECNRVVKPTYADGKKKRCTKLGADKHACCESKIQKHRAANPEDGDPKLQGETGYRRPTLASDNQPIYPLNALVPTGPRPNLRRAFAAGGRSIRRAFKALRGNCFPDAALILGNGGRQFVDFKFGCPPGHPSGRGTSTDGTAPGMSPRQQGSYDALGLGSGGRRAITISVPNF